METEKILALLPLFVVGTVCGYLIGRDISPDATKPDTARIYLAMYGEWRLNDFEHRKGSLTLRAGNRIYHYGEGDIAVKVDYLSPQMLATAPMPKRDYDSDFEKLVSLGIAGTDSISILHAIVTGVKDTGLRGKVALGERILVMVITCGGIALGYYIGHRKEPDFSEPKFEEELTSNTKLWTEFEAQWHGEYSGAFERGITDIVRTPKTSWPKTIGDLTARMSTSCVVYEKNRGILDLHPEICRQIAFDPASSYVLEFVKKYAVAAN